MNLKEIREHWESGDYRVIKGFWSVDNQVWVTFLKVIDDGKCYYTLHRYFKVGESWEVSVDVYKVTADLFIDKIGDYMGY